MSTYDIVTVYHLRCRRYHIQCRRYHLQCRRYIYDIRLTYDVSRYKRSHTILYTICNSWVLGQVACFITRRVRRTVLPQTVRCCIKMPLRTRFSTTCSAISSTTFPSFRTCILTGLPLPLTSPRTWAPYIQRFGALLLSQSWWLIWKH